MSGNRKPSTISQLAPPKEEIKHPRDPTNGLMFGFIGEAVIMALDNENT